MQLQLQKLCGDAAEMLSTVKAQTEQAKRLTAYGSLKHVVATSHSSHSSEISGTRSFTKRLTGRLLKHVKSSEAQLAESRDAMTSLRQEAQTANNRLQATM